MSLRLMCSAEAARFSDQDVNVADSVIDGATNGSRRPEDLPAAGHLVMVRGELGTTGPLHWERHTRRSVALA
ncbi:MAG TPA: hypothetical protein VG034_13945, partial [Acidimicrobiia bacterium]|nr:hypothetical protein [Acidimicrobiia bacterium]